MTKRRVQLFSVGLLLSCTLSALVFARFTSAQEIVTPENVARSTSLAEFANYRQWVRVNEKPLPVLDTSSVFG